MNTENNIYRCKKEEYLTAGKLKQFLQSVSDEAIILLADQNGQGSVHSPYEVTKLSISDLSEQWDIEYLTEEIVTLTKDEDENYTGVFNSNIKEAVILDCSW